MHLFLDWKSRSENAGANVSLEATSLRFYRHPVTNPHTDRVRNSSPISWFSMINYLAVTKRCMRSLEESTHCICFPLFNARLMWLSQVINSNKWRKKKQNERWSVKRSCLWVLSYTELQSAFLLRLLLQSCEWITFPLVWHDMWCRVFWNCPVLEYADL